MFRSRLPSVRPRAGVTAVIVVCWGASVVGGMSWLAVYSGTPGPTTVSASQWPVGSQLERSVTLPTLVLFVHPRCPCSRATLDELAVLAARCHGRFAGYVVFAKPRGVEPDWERGPLWTLATNVPGLTVLADDGEVEAGRFGAATSGHAFLYGPDGGRLFSGGLTRSRGHSGDNAGRGAIVSLLLNDDAPIAHAPVYGCRLTSSLPTPSAGTEPCPRN